MRARLTCLGSLTLLLALQTAGASAQQWLGDRARSEGRGIQAGPLVLHPGIGVETGWDSNVFLAEKPNEEDSVVLRVAPHFDLSTPEEATKLSFRGGANASLRHYFATEMGTTLGIGQNARLKWQPVPVFAWEIFNDYSRTALPFTEPGGPSAGGSATPPDYGRNQIGVGSRLQVSSSSGLLKGGLGYRLDFDIFDDAIFNANDTTAHSVNADSSWEFLPKTAVYWNSTFKFRDYDDPDAPSTGERNDSRETLSRVGLNGALTARIGFTLGVGYGAGFFDDGDDYENLLAQVEARYRLTDTSQWALGYDRTTSPSYFGNSMNSDRVRTRLELMFGGVVLIGAKAEATFISFGRDDSIAGAEERDDIQLVTNLNGEYRFTDWFALTAELGYSRNFTDYEYPAIGMIPADPAEWSRFEAWLGLRAFL